MPLSKLGKSAIAYAKSGLKVFPVKPRDKIPLGQAAPHGCRDATMDAGKITTWWTEYPDANVGIACGNGLVVLDIDAAHGGDGSLIDLESEHGKLPDTPMVLTGGGGKHYYYTGSTAKNKVGLYPGIDVRGEGGYVVAPPSIHPNGKPYEWEVSSRLMGDNSVKMAPAPSWMVGESKRGQANGTTADRIDPVAILAGVPEGKRDDQLFKYACKLRADPKMTKAEAIVLIETAAKKAKPPFDTATAREKIERAWEEYPAGDGSRAAFFQSIVASLEEPTVAVAGTTIRMSWPTMNLRFIAKNLRESNGKIDCKFRVEGNIPGVPESVLHSAHLSVLSTSSRQDAERALRRAVDGIDWWPFLLKFCNAVEDALDYGQPIERIRSSDKKAPGVSYIIRPLVMAGLPMALYADRGVGKSYVAALLVALALHPEYADRLHLSAEVHASGVLWLDWEADRNTLLSRVQRLQEGLEMPNDLDFNYLSCSRPLAGEVERLKTDLPPEARQLVVIDSLGSASGGDLNKPEPALAFFRALRELGGSAIVIAQTSKGIDGGRSVYGSAFYEYYFRNIWSAFAQEDRSTQELHVGLFNTKNNYDQSADPVGFRFCFRESAVKVYPRSPDDLGTDKRAMDIKAQILDFLRVAGKPVELADLKRAFPATKTSTITGTISKLCRNSEAVLLERGTYAASVHGGDNEAPF